MLLLNMGYLTHKGAVEVPKGDLAGLEDGRVYQFQVGGGGSGRAGARSALRVADSPDPAQADHLYRALRTEVPPLEALREDVEAALSSGTLQRDGTRVWPAEKWSASGAGDVDDWIHPPQNTLRRTWSAQQSGWGCWQ